MRTLQHILFLSMALIAGCATLRSGYRRVDVEIECPEIKVELPVEQPYIPHVHYNPEDKVA